MVAISMAREGTWEALCKIFHPEFIPSEKKVLEVVA